MTIQKNDVVHLHARSPQMQVAQVNGEKADCVWFDKDDKKHHGTFDISMLKQTDHSLNRNR